MQVLRQQALYRQVFAVLVLVCCPRAQTLKQVATIDLPGPKGERFDDLTILAAAGINTLTLDMRGYGESGGTPYGKLTDTELKTAWRGWDVP